MGFLHHTLYGGPLMFRGFEFEYHTILFVSLRLKASLK